jgi:hypothetical protein
MYVTMDSSPFSYVYAGMESYQVFVRRSVRKPTKDDGYRVLETSYFSRA